MGGEDDGSPARLLARGGRDTMHDLTGSMHRPSEDGAAPSIDDDGGGSESNWEFSMDGREVDLENLFADVPVGIREFMRTEKMLRDRHIKEAAR